ncbi:MAG: sigma-70 family RNA polymerase sigma factor [Phycisphaerae bacterium]|nr:sigma-70 family RNA polymerase sigma factor [Phycisphaerae bacterium]
MKADSDGQREAAFRTLAADRRDAMVRAAGRIVRDADEADDVVQETLAEVWLRLDRVPAERLNAYVFRAVQNNALKRRARRRAAVSLGDLFEPAAPSDDGDAGRTIDPLTLEAALADLPTAQQAVIRMKYYVGLSFRQIGEVLAISTNTAAGRCRYALATLRKLLTKQDKSGEEP